MIKKQIIAIAALVLLFGLTGCDLLWQRYSDRKNGFSLFLPRFWYREENLKGTAVIAFSPLKSAGDKFQENINVRIKELPNEVTIDTFFEINKNWLLQSGIKGVKSNISESVIYSGRHKGMLLAFDNKTDSLSLRIIIAMWIKNKRAYIVNYVSEIAQFPEYEPFFKKTLHSFRIK